MNRVGAIDAALARRSTTLLLLGIGGFGFWWASQSHDASYWVFPGLCIGLLRRGNKARELLAANAAWQSAWNAAAGEAPPAAQAPPAPWSGPRNVFLIALWAFFVFVRHILPAGDPNALVVNIIVIVLSVWRIGAVLIAVGRRLGSGTRAEASPRAKERPAREYIVSICIPKPGSSPSLSRIVNALPAYCRALLQRNGAAPSDRQEAPFPMH